MKIVYHLAAFEEIRRLPALDSLLESASASIAEACGDGYEHVVDQGPTRSRASVYTYTAHAMNSNAKYNTLVKNVDAGRSL